MKYKRLINLHNKSKEYRRVFILMLSIIVILSICLAGPYIVPNDPYETNLYNILKSPNNEYYFGTDSLGRCVFSRVLTGGYITIFSALALVLITFTAGSIIGIISGYYGGKVDRIIMRIVDIFFAFPDLVIAIAVAGVLGGGLKNAMISIGLVSWSKYARLARSEVLTLKDEVFIHAAILSGNSNVSIIIKHVIPNVIGTLITASVLDVGNMIMKMAGLSFLGLSVPYPIPEWGLMMSEGKSYIQFAPWIILCPGIAIFIAVTVFNLFGDALNDFINHKNDKHSTENSEVNKKYEVF